MIKASEYEYSGGSAPQNDGEVALTKEMSEQLGAKIGDIITIDFGTEKKDCMVVGYFQSLNQLGTVIRLHEDAPASMEYASSMMGFQIDFNDSVEEDEVNKRIKKIKDYYGIEDVFNAREYCNDCMGGADVMGNVSKLLLIVTCIVVILVTVLMERSFISDERSQIALLKAIGFKDSFIIRWHVYRLLVVSIVSEVLAVIFTYPVTKLWCDPIWNMMGAGNVDYYFKPVSLLIIYPGIILIFNFMSVLFTAMYTKKIVSNDVRNIE